MARGLLSVGCPSWASAATVQRLTATTMRAIRADTAADHSQIPTRRVAATILALRSWQQPDAPIEFEGSPVPIIQIPPPYRGPTEGASEIQVDGATLLECVEEIERKYPGFGPLVVDEDGNPLKFATWFLNGDKLVGEILATALEPGDSIEIISSVAGG